MPSLWPVWPSKERDEAVARELRAERDAGHLSPRQYALAVTASENLDSARLRRATVRAFLLLALWTRGSHTPSCSRDIPTVLLQHYGLHTRWVFDEGSTQTSSQESGLVSESIWIERFGQRWRWNLWACVVDCVRPSS